MSQRSPSPRGPRACGTRGAAHGGRLHSQRGVSAVLLALCLPVMLGLVALGLDLGRAYTMKAELQNAMDACALAASASLSGANDPMVYDVARAYALVLVDPQAQGQAARPEASLNRVFLQSEVPAAASIEVAFSAKLDGPFVAATSTQTLGLPPAQARYVRCKQTDAPRGLWLMPVLQAMGLDAPRTLTVSAEAVAALSSAQSLCAMPLAVCAVPGSTQAQGWGLVVGRRLTSVDNPAAGYGSGNFGWADFSPPNGGASELSGLIEGQGACGVQLGQSIGQPGQVTSIGRSWNTRFGIYANAADAKQSPPDYTGWGYAGGNNNLSDYLSRRAARSPFQGNVGGGIAALSSAQHATWGAQRRLVTVPIVDCSVWNGGKGSAMASMLDLACVLMLAPVKSGSLPSGPGVSNSFDVEFLGRAGYPGAPCATNGAVGGNTGPLVPGLVQ